MILDSARTATIRYITPTLSWTSYRSKLYLNINYFLLSVLLMVIEYIGFGIFYFYGADMLFEATFWFLIGIFISSYKI